MRDSELWWGISSEDLWIVRLESARTASHLRDEKNRFIFCERSWKTVLTTSVTEQRRSKRTSRPHTKLQSLWVAHQIFILLKKQLQARASHFERSGFWFLRFFFHCFRLSFGCLKTRRYRRTESAKWKASFKDWGSTCGKFNLQILHILQCKDPSVILMWCITLHHLGIAKPCQPNYRNHASKDGACSASRVGQASAEPKCLEHGAPTTA